eukprot:snap_masked-scaffold425_size175135-processed-gene-0.17 protein:Tk05837 transcript:snap_masked-scaffold425_size175135-processed-gene-0.17-mRNA-1 annotation:"zinc finger protein glis3-like"
MMLEKSSPKEATYSLGSKSSGLSGSTSSTSSESSSAVTTMHLEAQIQHPSASAFHLEGHHGQMFYHDDLNSEQQLIVGCGSPVTSPFRVVNPGTCSSSQCCPGEHQFHGGLCGGERIFQFPPTSTVMDTGCSKDELWNMASLTSDPFATLGTVPITSQYSPMAISPNMNSSLNTPRGSITSIRSHQHSPMHMDPVPMLGLESNPSMKEPSPLSFLNSQDLLFHTDNPPITMYESSHDLHASYPSPPRSGYNSPVPTHQHTLPTTLPPPSYEQTMQMSAQYGSTYHEHHHDPLHQSEPSADQVELASVMHTDIPLFAMKAEPDLACVASPILIQRNLYGNLGQQQAAEVSPSGPETPDSSVKEEMLDLNSPDTGRYVCLWMSCHEEFGSQKVLVDHVNDTHMETKKGCDELPCLWQDCPRKLKPFNAKYKLLTHMRVHTKEKPYKCEHEGCDRAFARLENRKIHFRSHTGDKPFSCKYAKEFNCSKKFSNSSDRAKHEQTHKDPKPYRCEVVGCTKRYTDPSSLRKHVKSHTLEEQDQYRRFKDQVNQYKMSSSPRFQSPSRPSSNSWSNTWSPLAQSNRGSLASPMAGSLSSSLLAGGSIVKLEDLAAHSPSSMAPSPLRLDHLMQSGDELNGELPTSTANCGQDRAQTKEGFLVHQPNSLDDLDEDPIPLDDVPIRFDDTFCLATAQWVDANTTTTSVGGAHHH